MAQGAQGDTGAAGASGPMGLPGRKGFKGTAGVVGAPGPDGGVCEIPADIVFAIDESGSISADDFNLAKTFFAQLVRGLWAIYNHESVVCGCCCWTSPFLFVAC